MLALVLRMKSLPMKPVSTIRFAPLVALLILCTTAACGGDGGNPTAASTEPTAFSTIDLVLGAGEPATAGQPVTIAYTIWDHDSQGTDGKGTVLDQSANLRLILGDTSFPEGWNMGLEGMRVGGRRRVVVPRGLGFTGPVVLEFELLTATAKLGVPFATSDLVLGTGSPVVAGQTLTVAYTGWIYGPALADNKGFVFDQSTSLSFVLGDTGLITGWNQGVTGMQVGGLRRIVIPPELGFGLNPMEGIPAYSTLIFEIDLTSVGE